MVSGQLVRRHAAGNVNNSRSGSNTNLVRGGSTDCGLAVVPLGTPRVVFARLNLPDQASGAVRCRGTGWRCSRPCFPDVCIPDRSFDRLIDRQHRHFRSTKWRKPERQTLFIYFPVFGREPDRLQDRILDQVLVEDVKKDVSD